MATVVISAIGYVMSAYSAVMAVKALADGDIMGAVVAGVGAYAGFTATSAFAASAGADAGAAVSTGVMADAGAAALPELSLSGAAAVEGAMAPVTSGLAAGAPLAASTVPLAAPITQTSTGAMGIIEQATSLATEAIDGVLKLLPDGTLQDTAGKIYAQSGELLSGGSAGMMNTGLKVADLYMKDKQAGEAQDSLEERQDYYDKLYANRGKVPDNVATYKQLRSKFDDKTAGQTQGVLGA